MAYSRSYQKNGGGTRETLLWTNPSPNSDYAGSTSLLSWSTISQYSALKLVWKGNKTDSNDNSVYMIVPLNPREAYYVPGYAATYGMNSNQEDGKGYTRQFRMGESYGLNIGEYAQRIQTSGTSKSYSIPLEIYGID